MALAALVKTCFHLHFHVTGGKSDSPQPDRSRYHMVAFITLNIALDSHKRISM